jgi:hypothetical protein
LLAVPSTSSVINLCIIILSMFSIVENRRAPWGRDEQTRMTTRAMEPLVVLTKPRRKLAGHGGGVGGGINLLFYQHLHHHLINFVHCGKLPKTLWAGMNKQERQRERWHHR